MKGKDIAMPWMTVNFGVALSPHLQPIEVCTGEGTCIIKEADKSLKAQWR